MAQFDEQKLANYSLILIGIVLIGLILQTFSAVLRPLAIAGLMLLIIIPCGRYFKARNIPTWAGISTITVVFIVAIAVIIALLSSELGQLQKALPSVESDLDTYTQSTFGALEKFGLNLNVLGPERLGALGADLIRKSVAGIRVFFTELLFSLIFLFFLIPLYNVAIKNIDASSNEKRVKKVKQVLQEVEEGVQAYLSTKFWVSLGTAVTSAIIILIFSGNLIMTSAFIIFAFNFIPVIGSIIAVIIILLFNIFATGITLNFILLALLLLATQIFFGNYLEPKLAGQRLNLSPIIILISLAVWTWIWGIGGALISIPLTMIIKILLVHSADW